MKYTDHQAMSVRHIWGLLLLAAAPSYALDLKAKSALIVEDRTGVVLYQKDADAARYPASITKILTAIILLERTRPDEIIQAPLDTETVTGASLHLRPGESLTASDLLIGILLRSANDACHALAVHVSGSDLAFAKLMNDRAKQIGCTGSNFMAPHGLHHDKHYVTARDMGLIAREAMKFPEIRDIVGIRKATISRSINTQDTRIISKNRWLDADKTAEGIKTGFTNKAGNTFVGAASRNGFRVITVILASEDWFGDQQKMVSWAYQKFTRSAPLKKGDEVGEIAIVGGESSTVKVRIDADIQYAHEKNKEPGFSRELVAKPELEPPIAEGDEVGTLTITDAKGWSKTVPVFAAQSVDRSPLRAASSPTFMAIAIALGASTLWIRRKSRRSAGTI